MTTDVSHYATVELPQAEISTSSLRCISVRCFVQRCSKFHSLQRWIVSVFKRWLLNRDVTSRIEIGSVVAWVVPNVHGADRLFIDDDTTLTVQHLRGIWDCCATRSLVLTSAHSGIVGLAHALNHDSHLFRWTTANLEGGTVPVRWACPEELGIVRDFHLAWRGHNPEPVEKWAMAEDPNCGITGVVAQTSSTQDVGFTSSLIVQPPWRRRGIGLSLIAHVLNNHLHSRSCAALVHRADNLPSRQLCDRLRLNSVAFVALESTQVKQLATGAQGCVLPRSFPDRAQDAKF
ncbi:MAG: GNAT family N-acetyltransferase [Candidatus Sulfotelmatobacter sp.]